MRNRLLAAALGLVVLLAVAAVVFAVMRSSSGTPAAAPVHTITPSPTTTAPHRRHPRPRTRPTPRTTTNPFAGVTVGIDPGHNGGNGADPSYLDRPVWNGREHEPCNTTGTETDSGYTEATFTFHVATYLAADLRHGGAHPVLTRTSNTGVGPCVNRRARIINASHAAVAIDIHADGGPPAGRGFTVLEPVADGPNDHVIGKSLVYGTDLRNAFVHTGMPTSTYYGSHGLIRRDDLAGLNLTTVPQALLECGNMRNATDAALLRSPSFQRRAARAIMSGMAVFLTGQRKRTDGR